MIRTLTVIALILVLLAVSACSGDDSDTESSATTRFHVVSGLFRHGDVVWLGRNP